MNLSLPFLSFQLWKQAHRQSAKMIKVCSVYYYLSLNKVSLIVNVLIMQVQQNTFPNILLVARNSFPMS